MDVVERLTLETAGSHELIACEHRHRYQFAAPLCRDRSVLDLCCGSGYGTEILSARARQVVGVDHDVGTVDLARATLGHIDGVCFEAADAIGYLRGSEPGRFEAIVCFEGLEHLRDAEQALALLREHVEAGTRLVVSVPNSKLFDEDNPFHHTDFDYKGAVHAFAAFPETVVVPQFLAEGSLIVPPQATETEVSLFLDDRDEPAYANHFLVCVGFAEQEVSSAHNGQMQLQSAPAYNRHMQALERAYADLRRANASLARARLGKSGSAAASFLAKAEAWRVRAEEAEKRVAELEGGAARPGPRKAATGVASAPPAAAPDRCMNAWDDRYRRARENLIPWIETAIDLEGRAVLEYGCGNAPVSCAFAERVERHIGIDIDPKGVETGRRKAAELGLENLELHVHPLEGVLDAMASYRGDVDVVLLYAVLEHLTLEERLAVLRLAREIVEPDGFVVVCETPNRFFPIDHHTSQLPFFTMLPDELALMLYEHSRRPDFLNSMAAAMRDGSQAASAALTRWGRGVSFHEFELVFDDLSDYVAASNYEPTLFAERPVHPDELALARVLERVRPDLAPVWSRSWLDLVLTAWPQPRRPSFLRPWSMQTADSPGVAWTAGERLWIPDSDTPLRVSLPAPTSRLVVGAEVDAGRLEVSARPQPGGGSLSAEARGEPGQGHYISFELSEPAQLLEVSLSRPGEVFFVGYEG